MTYSPISLAAEVQDGLTARRAVVALETSAIAQGLPFPFNLEAADRMEVAIRGAGAIPAMVGVLDGVIRVGLGRSEVRRLAEGADVVKLGRRDLAAAAAFRETGGTTVSAVLHVCTMTGVAVFATGGIGGVHRGGALDVSEDLAALTCSSVVVVCSGAKSLLDLPATVERLESDGVIVAALGTDEFPAFYSRESGLPVQRRIDSPEEAARLLMAARALGLGGAVVLAAPPPEPLPADQVEAVLALAEAEVAAQKVTGNALTPALLAAAGRLDPRLIRANIALLEQNAKIAAEVALALG